MLLHGTLRLLPRPRRIYLSNIYKLSTNQSTCKESSGYKQNDFKKTRTSNYKHIGIGFGLVVGFASLVAINRKLSLVNKESKKLDKCNKKYTRKEVSKHNTLENGVWVIYQGKVYDITDFVERHPGGSGAIMMGAGGDVSPFWETYVFHKKPEVQNLLETYLIGELDESATDSISESSQDPYATDPKRSPHLIVLSDKPFNAETPAKLLIENQITPTEIFFVRNHLPVPEVDIEDYKLEICIGSDGDEDNLEMIAEYTYEELKSLFKPHTVESIIQCSGNRRKELKKVREIKGLDWGIGAFGNAKWTGVRLIDILDRHNVNEASSKFKHLQMGGLDCDMSGKCYSASISSDIAFDAKSEVLLAYEMNGEPLTRDHGFPIRLIAPGVTGARNVKWLSKLILSNEESTGHWQRNDYKSFSPSVDMFTVDYSKSISIQEMPVQSAICDPQSGDKLRISSGKIDEANKEAILSIPVNGYAWSGGGKLILRVDVSIDNGATWQTASLEQEPDFDKRNKTWHWTRWKTNIELPVEEFIERKKDKVEICCRAVDSAYNSQPERAETIWNVRGVVNNCWHRVELYVEVD